MIRIITDSTCEAPDQVLRHPAVTVLPLSVVFGQTVLRDGIDITREEFWKRLPGSDPLPTTSQARPSDFQELYQRFLPAGDELIVLVISGKLSATLGSALTAAESFPGAPIDVVDSKNVSIGLGLMLQEAVEMLDRGASRAEIVARLSKIRDEIRIVFALETLEYLQKGGRIGKAQAFVGTLLKFKPLLGIVDGEVVPLARVRSRAKALEAVQELLLQQVPARGQGVRIAMTQALAEAEARQLGEALAGKFGARNFFTAFLGPVIGVHVGPGTIGVGVYPGS